MRCLYHSSIAVTTISKTSQHLCYFRKNNKQRGSRVSFFKNSIFDVFATGNFRMLCDWKWTHQCYHLAMETLIITLHSQWHCHCKRMTLSASPESSRLVRVPGMSTNVWSIYAAQQSTVGPLTAINSAFKFSQDGVYDALTKTYSKLKNYLTTKIYK